jgi:hypothetical protein
VHCVAGAWNPWGVCSRTCGGGHRIRVKDYVTRAMHGGKSCSNMKQVQKCNPQACPVDCLVHGWSHWSKCSKTCGTGSQTKTRRVARAAKNGGKACPTTSATQKCGTATCPIHCDVGKWGAFGPCSKTCGNGSQKRTRAILKLPKHGGFSCPSLVNVRVCASAACPRDCVVTAWSSYSPFAGGKNQLRRTRRITTLPAHGGKKCPATVQTVHHKTVAACQSTSAFGEWSKCTATCGQGYQYRMWERITCSETSTLKHHVSMRQGRHCWSRACKNGEAHSSVNVYVPPIAGAHRAKAGLPAH